MWIVCLQPASTSCNMNITSRPSSQLSQYGSSGYGSTRSHVGPRLNSQSQSLALLPKNKFSTLQTRTSKRGSNMGEHYPQFYSMRLRKRNQTDRSISHPDGNCYRPQIFQLHQMPIKENSPESKLSVQEAISGNKNEVNNNSNINQRLDSIVPPVPAPRKHHTNKSAKHTYQNVPIPITPNTQEPSPGQVSCKFFAVGCTVLFCYHLCLLLSARHNLFVKLEVTHNLWHKFECKGRYIFKMLYYPIFHVKSFSDNSDYSSTQCLMCHNHGV